MLYCCIVALSIYRRLQVSNDMSLIIGNHVHKEGSNFADAIKRDIEMAKGCGMRMNAAQIFVIGPRNSKQNITDADCITLKKMTDSGFKIVTHGSYLTNPWGAKSAFGIMLARKELELCDKFGSAGLIIHLARVPPETIAAAIPKIFAGSKPDADGTIVYTKSMLWLEIESYAADECTYEDNIKISKLLDELRKVLSEEEFARIGICLDTAHMWAAGVDISDYDSASTYIRKMRMLEVPLMIHLNDQIWAIGQGRDEHAPLGYGTIWDKYRVDGNLEESGLYAFLEHAYNDDIMLILERKSDQPKINGLPAIDNRRSDYHIVGKLGFVSTN